MSQGYDGGWAVSGEARFDWVRGRRAKFDRRLSYCKGGVSAEIVEVLAQRIRGPEVVGESRPWLGWRRHSSSRRLRVRGCGIPTNSRGVIASPAGTPRGGYGAELWRERSLVWWTEVPRREASRARRARRRETQLGAGVSAVLIPAHWSACREVVFFIAAGR